MLYTKCINTKCAMCAIYRPIIPYKIPYIQNPTTPDNTLVYNSYISKQFDPNNLTTCFLINDAFAMLGTYSYINVHF